MKYQSGGSFRRALETRLRDQSLETGMPLVRLRKMVAFDRFLARLMEADPPHWILKGGLVLQLRLGQRARTTKDIDVLYLEAQEEAWETLRNAGRRDIGDWFEFEVDRPSKPRPDTVGVMRHKVQSRLDGRTFENFHIDVGIGCIDA